ncbi:MULTISPECIES: hypothetical protein [Microbacterium]|uniref:hypothetical protein n=1 Tax=Microbacterium TaxID=33882 RepID=UPI0013A5667A|nr:MULTISPECIES: hypothetical protein [Microbacterium]
MTRKGLATAGVGTVTLGATLLAVPLTTIQTLNPVSIVGGGVIVVGLGVLAAAGFRRGDSAPAQPTPAAVRREEIKNALRIHNDALIDAKAALTRNDIARKHSASFSDGGAHLYDTLETRLASDRDKIEQRIAELEEELQALDRSEAA